MKIKNFKFKINAVDLLLLFAIITLGLFLRLYGINWDSGFHLHPDERAITMFTLPLEIPKTLDEFFLPSSSLNPHFFAYGNFPLYLLKGAAYLLSFINPALLSYEKINLLGRFVSVIADVGNLLLIYVLGKKIFNRSIGLIAVFLYACAVFPIQASHFYAVDILLTFFILLTLYQLLEFYEKTSVLNSLLVGIFFGFSLATKISAIPLITTILFTLAADFILIFIKQPHKIKVWLPHLPVFLKRLITDGFIILATTFLTFSILEPYTLIDFQEFLKQNIQQSQMTKNAFTFPYTLQYVGKIPYLYELKNIFLWGMGPIIAAFAFLGFVYFSYLVFKKETKEKDAKQIIVYIFIIVYFLIVGKFAVGFMRYMLPIYPLLSIFAAVIIFKLLKLIKHKLNYWYLLVVLIFICGILIWPLSFISIYSKPNTRITASNWINANINVGKTIAIEHWDDGLPLFGGEKYKIQTLELYNPDTPQKWEIINNQLSQTDYIILASNRLYTPLQKLTDCINLPQNYCYPLTAKYYQDLFGEKLGFKKVAEFTSYPTIPLLNVPINDQSADESFTVYDHPKIMIFRKYAND